MSLISIIIIALALAISTMLLMRRCAESTPIALSSGLLVSFALSVIHTALFLLGVLLGNMMRFELPDNPSVFARANGLIYLGFSLFVSLKMLWPYLGRRTRPAAYALNAGTLHTLLFTIASGINGFLVALGVGFVTSLDDVSVHAVLWPLLVLLFLFSYLGIMFGRQHVELRPRRWQLLSSLLILAPAVWLIIAT